MSKFVIKTRENKGIRVYYDVKKVWVNVAECVSMESLAREYIDRYRYDRGNTEEYGWILKDMHETILDNPLEYDCIRLDIPKIESCISSGEYKGYVAFILNYYIDNRKTPYRQSVITTEDSKDQVIYEFMDDVAFYKDVTIITNKPEIIL